MLSYSFNDKESCLVTFFCKRIICEVLVEKSNCTHMHQLCTKQNDQKTIKKALLHCQASLTSAGDFSNWQCDC